MSAREGTVTMRCWASKTWQVPQAAGLPGLGARISPEFKAAPADLSGSHEIQMQLGDKGLVLRSEAELMHLEVISEDTRGPEGMSGGERW